MIHIKPEVEIADCSYIPGGPPRHDRRGEIQENGRPMDIVEEVGAMPDIMPVRFIHQATINPEQDERNAIAP